MDYIHQKKSNRISQAIYLASNHIKDSEPLKWELRKETISFLSYSRSITDNLKKDIHTDFSIDIFSSSVNNLISMLFLASSTGLISVNNANIIIYELETIVSLIKKSLDEGAVKAGFILSDDFFATDHDISSSNRQKSGKRHDLEQNPSLSNIKEKKDDRQSKIISLLKNQSGLTIKDFLKVIEGCSEKTIQRELSDLVNRGIVKKEGERRWSKYSLK